MNIGKVFEVPNRWVKADGPQADIVFSCRVRLARNLRDFVFPPWGKKSHLKEAARLILKTIENSDYFKNHWVFDMNRISLLEREFLLERHLISKEFTRGDETQFLVTVPGETISIMVNEEDHLRIQTILSGLQLMQAWEICNSVDDRLDNSLEYAFSPKFGYLTSCLTNVGTGLRASCMLHLSALVRTSRIDDVLKNVSKLGLVTRGFYGEGSRAQGDFFQISNQVTLGLQEKEIISTVSRVVRQVVKEEKNAREYLMQHSSLKVMDEVGRAYGILSNAHLISYEEAMVLLSKLRLGVWMGIIPYSISVDTINEFFISIGPAQIQVSQGRRLSRTSRDKIRAKMIREKLSNA